MLFYYELCEKLIFSCNRTILLGMYSIIMITRCENTYINLLLMGVSGFYIGKTYFEYEQTIKKKVEELEEEEASDEEEEEARDEELEEEASDEEEEEEEASDEEEDEEASDQELEEASDEEKECDHLQLNCKEENDEDCMRELLEETIMDVLIKMQQHVDLCNIKLEDQLEYQLEEDVQIENQMEECANLQHNCESWANLSICYQTLNIDKIDAYLIILIIKEVNKNDKRYIPLCKYNKIELFTAATIKYLEQSINISISDELLKKLGDSLTLKSETIDLHLLEKEISKEQFDIMQENNDIIIYEYDSFDKILDTIRDVSAECAWRRYRKENDYIC
jgi:hypothetical protein